MKKFCTYFNILTLAAMLMVGVDNAWGAWPEYEGTTSIEGGYVLEAYTGSNQYWSNGAGAGEKELALSGPGATVSYYAWRKFSSVYYHLYVEYFCDGSWIQAQDNTSLPTSKPNEPFTCKIPARATKIRFRFPSGGTLTKYVSGVRVTLASVYQDPEPSPLTFDAAGYNTDDSRKDITIDWSNIDAMSCSGLDNTQFTAMVTANNSEKGNKFNTAIVSVSYKHDKPGTHSATLSVAGKTVTLTGTTNKIPTYISSTPTIADIAYGATLDNNYIGTDGVVKADVIDAPGTVVSGTWSIDEAGSQIIENSSKTITLRFTPDDQNTYEVVTTSVNIKVLGIPTLTWADAYSSENPSIPLGQEITDAVTSSAGVAMTYSSSDEDVIAIIDNGAGFKAVGVGTATVTASHAQTDSWAAASTSKTFKTTNKIIQVISCAQNLTRLKTNNVTVGLQASVFLQNNIDGTNLYSPERTNMLTYTTSNSNVFTVSGTTLIVVGAGDAILTISVPGDEDYESASVALPVKVRAPSVGCDDPIIYSKQDEVEFFQMNTDKIEKEELTFDPSMGTPDKLSFQYKGEYWKLGVNYFKGSIYAEQKVGGLWSKISGSEVTPEIGTYKSLDNLQLDSKATAVRFVRPKGGQGYHYVKNVEVTLRQYLESDATSGLDFGIVTIGGNVQKQFTIRYSNLKGDLMVVNSSPELTILPEVEIDCGDFGEKTIAVSYAPTTASPLNATITFTDPISNKTLSIPIEAQVSRGNQIITWNPAVTTLLVTDADILNANLNAASNRTESGQPLIVNYASSDQTIVSINNGVATILKPGTVTITASQNGSINYEAATPVSYEFIINKETLTLTAPSVDNMVYGSALNEVVPLDGEARDSKNNVVEGLFAWSQPETIFNVGTYTPQVIFTPTNHADWYNDATTTVPVTVLPAASSATATAANITYGQPVSASVLTNNGPTAGAWAWAEEIKNDVLAVGEHADLAVVFTPTDPNYSTIQGTVSLTVVEAPAENVFIGTDGDWNNAANWQAGVVPSTTTGVNITVTDGSNLTIGTDANIGNMIVEAGGCVDIADDAAVQVVNDFRIDSRYTSSDEAASGHVSNPDKITVTGNAYMELALDPSGQAQRGWYAFSVPFEVDMANGVYAIRGGEQTHIVNAVDFKVQYYSESRRAAGQYGWVRENSTLHPGVLYIITVDNRVEQNVIVFRAANNTITAATDIPVQLSAAGAAADKGWNGIGNATMGYAQLPAGTKLQVYNFADQCYDQKEADEVALVVGSGAFVQVSDEGTLPLTMVEPHNAATAPHRAAARVLDEFRVDLSREDGTECDRLYLSASEEATGEYTIGHDLVKMQPSATKAQLWSSAYGKQLCDVELPLLANKALVPLTLSTPTDDTYVLSVARTPDDAMLYLTYNGKIIWNLSMSEYYLDLAAGTDSAYGLLMVANNAPAITTGVDDAEQGDGVLKQIIDNKLYITLPNGMIFDATGNKIQ